MTLVDATVASVWGDIFHRPYDKLRSNNRASVRVEAYKVHREFRTQRGPLNVAPVLRRTV